MELQKINSSAHITIKFGPNISNDPWCTCYTIGVQSMHIIKRIQENRTKYYPVPGYMTCLRIRRGGSTIFFI